MVMMFPAMRATSVLLVVLCSVSGCMTLNSSSIDVPALKIRGEDAYLRCNYMECNYCVFRPEKDEEIRSVTWFKDGVEFYRFLKKEPEPEIIVKDVPGIEVDKEDSGDTWLTLKSVKVNSGGEYRCEASSHTEDSVVSSNSTMLVVAPPETDPVITGLEEGIWVPNGTLQLNCTASKSSPAAELKWLIKGEEAEDYQLTLWPTKRDEEGLESSKLGLALQLGPDLRTESVQVTCEAIVQTHFVENGTDSLVITDLFYNKSTSKTVRSEAGAAQTRGQLTAALLVLVCSVAAALVL